MSEDKRMVTKDTTRRTRYFSYKKGEASLDFTLRTDIKTQLKDFGECLVAAIEDVQKELDSK